MKKGYILIIVLLITFANLFAQNTSENCPPLWLQGGTGTNIGSVAMIAEDIDGDGVPELITDCEEGFWYVMKYNTLTDYYDIVYVSSYYFSVDLTSLQVLDADNDSDLEIVAGFKFGEVKIYDANTKFLEFEGNLGVNDNVFKVLFADGDNDGEGELMVLSGTYLHLYQEGSYIKDFSVVTYSNDFACGDAIPGNGIEIAFGNGNLCRIQNGEVDTLWHFYDYTSNLRNLEMVNTDNDDLMEIVLCEAMSVKVIDADIQQVKWSHPSLNYKSIYLKDINSDGKSEIYTSVAINRTLGCLSPENGNELWSHEFTDGIGAFAIADMDSDGNNELCRSDAYLGYTDYDFLYMHDLESFQEEWVSLAIDPRFNEINVIDVDHDSEPEIITIARSSNNQTGGAIMTIYDAQTRVMEWQSDPEFFQGSETYGIRGFETGDVDNDGITEIILAGEIDGEGTFWIMNGASHEIEDIHTCYGLGFFTVFALDDIDADGELEYFTKGERYYILDASDYTVEWSSDRIEDPEYPEMNRVTSGQSMIRIDNIDMDPSPEIVIEAYRKLQIFDGITHESYMNNTFWPESIDLFDVNGDGILEVIIGTASGEIGILDGQTYNISWLPFNLSFIEGIKVANLVGDAEPELLFFDASRLTGASFTDVLFVSPEMCTVGTPGDDDIIISDYNNDGVKEVFVSSYLQALEIDYLCYFNGPVSADYIPTPDQVLIYPVPASETLILELTEIDSNLWNAFAEIHNLQGQIIKTIKLTNNKTIVDTSSLAPGIYIINIFVDGEWMVQKFVTK